MLQYEKTGGDQVEKDLQIMTHNKKDGTPINAASGEVIKCFSYENSSIILVI